MSNINDITTIGEVALTLSKIEEQCSTFCRADIYSILEHGKRETFHDLVLAMNERIDQLGCRLWLINRICKDWCSGSASACIQYLSARQFSRCTFFSLERDNGAYFGYLLDCVDTVTQEDVIKMLLHGAHHLNDREYNRQVIRITKDKITSVSRVIKEIIMAGWSEDLTVYTIEQLVEK